MWIKDYFDHIINIKYIVKIYVRNLSDNTYGLKVVTPLEDHIIKRFSTRKDAEAARDELIRKLGGEVIEV